MAGGYKPLDQAIVDAADVIIFANDVGIRGRERFEGRKVVQSTPKEAIKNAKALALLGDSVTTDHISPAGSFKPTTPAGKYLQDHKVAVKDFNSYGARRGNHEVMMRGTFANIRIRNEMMGGAEGGNTIYYAEPNAPGETMSIFDAAQRYKADT